MKAAEEIDDRIKSFVDLNFRHAFKTDTELFISVLSDISWRELLLVHELLERVVTSLLEHHLVAKTVLDELIDLRLKSKELFRKEMRVLHVAFVHDNLSSTIKDVRAHLVDNQTKSSLVSLKNVKEEFELFKVLLLKHVDAARILRADNFSHLRDKLSLDNLEHLSLSFRLKPIVSIAFFILKHFLDFS